MNPSLIIGGVLSCVAALLHVGIIFGGPAWYRFFGAGERMASMDAAGSVFPALLTAAIAALLLVWGLYAFSGAGLLRPLPLLKPALLLITLVYLLRGLVLLPMLIFMPGQVNAFAVWSSLICLGYGLAYAMGTRALWSVAPV